MMARKKISLNMDAESHSYTEKEVALFSLLSEKPISSKQLSEKLFGKGALFGLHNVVSSMSILEKKIVTNKEPFVIASTKGKGPRPKMYWIERND